MTARKTIFSMPYGRLGVLGQLLLYPSRRKFVKMAEFHIKHRKQLAVFAFDHVSLEINTHGVYERKELETFFAWIESISPGLFTDSVVLDLGANIGNHSLYFSDYFKQVHAFEPNERTFRVLALNANLVTNVICHKVGLSDKDGTASFQVNSANIGASRIVPSGTSGVSEIRLTTLDAAVHGIVGIKLIKIDVEGHDYPALVGAKETILTHKPVILFEQVTEDTSLGESATVALLRSYGYRKFAVIRRHPMVSIGLPARCRLAAEFIGGLIFGETMKIEVVERLPEGHYAMVVAIPEWLKA